MGVTRRALLLGGLSVPLLAKLNQTPTFAAAANKLPTPALIAISGIGAKTDLVKLATFIDPFLIRTVPITITVDPLDSDGRPLGYNSDLARWMRLNLRRYADILEFGIHAEFVVSGDPYFQLRQISDAQNAFSFLINEFVQHRPNALASALTITTNSPLHSYQDCSAMRASGIRTIIRLHRGAKDASKLHPVDGGYWFTDTGLVNTFGSPLSSTNVIKGLSRDIPTLVTNIVALSKNRNPVVVDLPLSNIATLSESDIASYATELAREIAKAEASRSIRNILPHALYVQSREKESRFVIIRIDDLRISPTTDVGHMALVNDLIKDGYPATELVIPAPREQLLTNDDECKAYLKAMMINPRFDIATHGWGHASAELEGKSAQYDFEVVRSGIVEIHRSTGKFPMSYIPPNDAFDANTLDAVAATGTPLFSAERGNYQWITGLDRSGLLHASNTIMFEQGWEEDSPYYEKDQVLQFFGTENDAVFSIHPQTANTPEKKRRIFETLEALSAQRGTKLVNFEEYYRAITPAFPKFDQIRNARADILVRDWRPAGKNAQFEEMLKEDAALAWSYFEWGAKKFGGMAPATSWIEYGQQKGYPFTTMWDVGTYILASMSAHRLGIIDQAKFETTIGKILAFLGASSFRYAGVKLPHTERSLELRTGQREGFDSADTGRLLTALKILDAYADGNFPVSRLIAKWNFGPVLADGEMHVVSGRGKLSTSHKGSYAGYASQGYRLWGYQLKPVFDTQDPSRNMDEAVLALAEIQRRGRIATEPHITEEIELGGSPHGRLMADILYAAQMKRHRESGILTCVSEGPIAGAPYFTYQGFQLDDAGGKFVVDVQETSDASYDPKQRDSLRMVSSKAAYLWYAGRPGDYSDKLLAYVREHGRMAGMGFASGIFERTGKRTEVSDLNTNGIILESIAYILGGRKPFLQLDATDQSESINKNIKLYQPANYE